MKTLPAAVSVMAVVFLGLISMAQATPIVISGAMEGNLRISHGDTVRAGFDFTMPESHPVATVSITGSVTIFYTCPDKRSGSFTIPVSGTYTDPENDRANWFPSSSQSIPSVYQGSTIAPNVCSGQPYHAPLGATFAANVTSNDTEDWIYMRFHYSDNSPGLWSFAVSVRASGVSGSH
jgi:hypothetical protein